MSGHFRGMLKRISWRVFAGAAIGFSLVWMIWAFTVWPVEKVLNVIAPAVAALATVFIAYFTLTLKRSTDKLWAATTNQAQDADRALTITQRAYVGTEPLGINPFFSEEGEQNQIVGHVAFVNVGRLPARDVSVRQAKMKWCSSGTLEEKDLPITEAIEPAKTVLPPGTKMPLGSNTISSDVLQKRGSIYVWGKIKYTDGFGIERYTRFCHRYPCRRHDTGPDGERIKPEHARYHQHGNDAD